MRFRETLHSSTISALVAALVVTAVSLWAQDEAVTYRDALALGRPLDPEYGGVPSGAVIFVTTAACPTGYAEYATAQGRYVVGLPQNGTLAGTSGTALANLQVRRGGTSHAGPSLSTISVSDDFAVTYTRPTVTHAHTHIYHRERVVTGATGTLIGQGSARLLGDNPQTTGVSAAPVVSGGGVSLAGGGASLSGGISLSGGQISGGSASNQPPPAPYVQLLACQRS